jgi:hypothetical protein
MRGTYDCLHVLSQNVNRIPIAFKQLTGHSITGTNPHKFNRLLVLLVSHSHMAHLLHVRWKFGRLFQQLHP